jgi:hypothetical protein
MMLEWSQVKRHSILAYFKNNTSRMTRNAHLQNSLDTLYITPYNPEIYHLLLEPSAAIAFVQATQNILKLKSTILLIAYYKKIDLAHEKLSMMISLFPFKEDAELVAYYKILSTYLGLPHDDIELKLPLDCCLPFLNTSLELNVKNALKNPTHPNMIKYFKNIILLIEPL